MKLKLNYPVKNVSVNQSFGNVDSKYTSLGLKAHNGIDYYAEDGTPVLAAHDGTVTYAGLDGSNGNLVVIMTDTPFEYGDGEAYFKTLYGHLKTGTFKVTAGQKVKTGQIIAHADNTGFSSGSHLHFGLKPVMQGEQDWIWWNMEQNNGYNGAIDPTPYLPSHSEFTKEMKNGEYSEDIKKMQAFFIRIGLMQPIKELEFGWYGGKTSQAVYNFMLSSGRLSLWERKLWRGENVGKKTLEELNKQYK
jgi:hypothetical protein